MREKGENAPKRNLGWRGELGNWKGVRDKSSPPTQLRPLAFHKISLLKYHEFFYMLNMILHFN